MQNNNFYFVQPTQSSEQELQKRKREELEDDDDDDAIDHPTQAIALPRMVRQLMPVEDSFTVSSCLEYLTNLKDTQKQLEVTKKTNEELKLVLDSKNTKIRRLEQDVKLKDTENANLKLENRRKDIKCANMELEISLGELNTAYKNKKELKNIFESNLKKLKEDFESYSEEGKKALIKKLYDDFYKVKQLHKKVRNEHKDALKYIEKYINSKNPIQTRRF